MVNALLCQTDRLDRRRNKKLCLYVSNLKTGGHSIPEEQTKHTHTNTHTALNSNGKTDRVKRAREGSPVHTVYVQCMSVFEIHKLMESNTC